MGFPRAGRRLGDLPCNRGVLEVTPRERKDMPWIIALVVLVLFIVIVGIAIR